ncbi:MAG: peptide deformylase [Desulfobacterales bacterium]|nr:peptide deformylase [Desulfobacterales bacterium]MDX2510124.1 peptide deformylase [Desulfobacterales bacterium]
MSILEVVTYPDNFLARPTKAVENIDGKIQIIIDNMAETMYDAPGAGLAAIQVGCDKSIIVFDNLPGETEKSLQVFVNPKILESDGEIISEDEGCLSVPDFRSNVKRSSLVLVEGIDREGNPIKIEVEGYLAIVLQHEIDHLNGILFIDRISSLKRELYKRHIKKQLRVK